MRVFLFIFFLLSASLAHTQKDSLTKAQKDSLKQIKKEKKAARWWSLTGYPAAFFTPETNWGFGGFASYNFKMSKGRDTLENDSQIQLGGAYTLVNQVLLWAPFKVFWEENKNYAFGEVGYFKYFFYYYGIGNNTPLDNEEIYHVQFPRIRLHYTRKLKGGNLSLGANYWFEHYNITETRSGGLAEKSFGIEGGVTSGLGPLLVYDSRDHVFYPEKGWYVEAKVLGFPSWLGSAYDFYKGSVDASYYWRIHKKGVLANHLNWQYAGGDVPFNMMSLIGGTKRMRGYYEGRFRQNNAIILQTEYRLQLPWRLGLVAFADIGQTYEKTAYLQIGDWRWTAGGGLRFMLDPVRKINIRLDYGFGRETSGFYLTIGEAF
jgi:hypothetical protein